MSPSERTQSQTLQPGRNQFTQRPGAGRGQMPVDGGAPGHPVQDSRYLPLREPRAPPSAQHELVSLHWGQTLKPGALRPLGKG